MGGWGFSPDTTKTETQTAAPAAPAAATETEVEGNKPATDTGAGGSAEAGRPSLAFFGLVLTKMREADLSAAEVKRRLEEPPPQRITVLRVPGQLASTEDAAMVDIDDDSVARGGSPSQQEQQRTPPE